MSLFEKIYYTWVLIAIPGCLAAWCIDAYEHPLISYILIFFIWAPILIGLVGMFAYGISCIWC